MRTTVSHNVNTIGVAGAQADITASDPDEGIIAAADGFVARHREWRAMADACGPDDGDVLAVADDLHTVAGDLAAMRPVTLAGWQALARASVEYDTAGMDGRLAVAIARGLAKAA